MKRLRVDPTRRTPDIRRYVGVCMTCRHWQIDVRPGGVSDLGGARPTHMAMVEEHRAHLTDCPGAGGRVIFEGQWVEAPLMDGRPVAGAMELNLLPRWWVTR